MNAKSIAVLVQLVVLFLSGCAFTSEQITLEPRAQYAVVKADGASSVVVQVNVSDKRADRSKVSSKINGFGMETAPITATEDIAVTIRHAIEEGLKTFGFRIGAADAIVQVNADVGQLYNRFKIGFFAGDAIAELQMYVVVKSSDGKPVYMRTITAQGTEANIQLASGSNAQLALNRALEQGLSDLFEDREFVSALLGKKIARAN